MRIALITDAWFPQVNGVVRTLSNVCEELKALGHDLLIIHPGLFVNLPCPRYSEILLSVLPGRRLALELDRFAPQAIHLATEGPLGLAGRRYCLQRNVPFTTSYHTQFPHYMYKYAKVPPRLTYRFLRWFHGGAQSTLVPTPSIKSELDSRGFANISVWTRGVDTDLFQPYQTKVYDHERPICVYMGRVAPEKNIEAFLRADLPGTKVVIGDGPAMSAMRRRFADAKYVGYKHGRELAEHIADADVFVFPSTTDTFGVVMLEAMACGVPVAAYPVTGPIDVVKDGEVGALREDLAEACLAALNMNRDACRAYAQQFSWRRCAEMFFDHLAPLSDGRRAQLTRAV